jgi:hypothetical protein
MYIIGQYLEINVHIIQMLIAEGANSDEGIDTVESMYK